MASESRTYILTHRLAGKQSDQAEADAAEALDRHLSVLRRDAAVEHDTLARGPGGRRVLRVTAEPRWIHEQSAALHPDVIVERRIEYWPHFMGVGRRLRQHRAAAGDMSLQVTVRAKREPLENAEVTMMYTDAEGQAHLLPPQRTDAEGHATLKYHADCSPVAVAAYPAFSYWPVCQRQPYREVTLDCPPLPRTGPLAWWQQAMGIQTYREDAGHGIRIGSIGTGVSQHPCLPQVLRVDGKEDLDAHGTHVCGIIGARPVEPGQFAGLAPGTEIFSRRVFEMQDDELVPPDQGDLMLAVDAFAGRGGEAQHVDVINMSLGSDHSLGLQDAITHALQHGTICVSSAGNTSGNLEYPAAQRNVISVAALGKMGWGPQDSTSVFMMPDRARQPDHFGKNDLFLANFSCFGPRLRCAAPGDGLISTVPPRFGEAMPYAAMDGTSLASPAVCAVLAIVLSQSATYRRLPREERRARLALELFAKHCADVGLERAFQGAGLPRC